MSGVLSPTEVNLFVLVYRSIILTEKGISGCKNWRSRALMWKVREFNFDYFSGFFIYKTGCFDLLAVLTTPYCDHLVLGSVITDIMNFLLMKS